MMFHLLTTVMSHNISVLFGCVCWFLICVCGSQTPAAAVELPYYCKLLGTASQMFSNCRAKEPPKLGCYPSCSEDDYCVYEATNCTNGNCKSNFTCISLSTTPLTTIPSTSAFPIPTSGPGCTRSNSTNDASVCLTKSCLKLAIDWHANRGPVEDDEASISGFGPCTDFYEFACGSFPRRHAFNGSFAVSWSAIIERPFKEQMRTILSAPLRENDTRGERASKSFYQSCLNTSAIKAAGTSELKKLASELPCAPLMGASICDWNEDTYRGWEWHSAAILPFMGLNPANLIVVGPFFRPGNASVTILTLSQPSFDQIGGSLWRGMYYEYRSKELSKKAMTYLFTDYLKSVARLINPDATGESVAGVVKIFDMLIRDVFLREDRFSNKNTTENMMTVKDLKASTSFGKMKTKWDDFLHTIKLPAGQEVHDNTEINVMFLEYYQRLQPAFFTHDITNGDFANFLTLITIMNYLPYIDDMISPDNSGIYEKSRELMCCEMAKDHVGDAVDAVYVQNFFNEGAKEQAIHQTKLIRTALRSSIAAADWMDESTKAAALKKLDKLGVDKIGYPQYILETWNQQVDWSQEETTYNVGSLLENIKTLNFFTNEAIMKMVGRPIDSRIWTTAVTTINAFYDPQRNEMILPGAVLQYPIFTPDAPAYVNYGALGMVIGHELTHAFDDSGARYDWRGRKVEWWEEASWNRYTEKQQCFIDQYSNITEPNSGQQLNGTKTVGENIADNGGIKVAFQAYRMEKEMLTENRQRMQKLAGPGGDSPTDQLFFLSYANLWCSKLRFEAYLYYIDAGEHSLPKYRVNEPLKNYPAFSQAFNCPLGSPMNPEEKCKLW